ASEITDLELAVASDVPSTGRPQIPPIALIVRFGNPGVPPDRRFLLGGRDSCPQRARSKTTFGNPTRRSPGAGRAMLLEICREHPILMPFGEAVRRSLTGWSFRMGEAIFSLGL